MTATKSSKSVKASEKQAICRKLVTLLKKRYPAAPPANTRPVLETMLYAICLEDTTYDEAEKAYERLFSDFFDLNEVRVSSISELAEVLANLPEAEWKAYRVRTLLNEIFERHYAFEFEQLRRKTLDQAQKELDKIPGLSPFVRLYTLQTVLKAHVVPLDRTLTNAAIWLGLATPDAHVEDAAHQVKSAVRKPDVALFCHYLRCLATDPAVSRAFDFSRKPAPEEGFDVLSAPVRLEQLFAEADEKAERKAAQQRKRAAAARKAAATRKKAATKRTTAVGKRRKK